MLCSSLMIHKVCKSSLSGEKLRIDGETWDVASGRMEVGGSMDRWTDGKRDGWMDG